MVAAAVAAGFAGAATAPAAAAAPNLGGAAHGRRAAAAAAAGVFSEGGPVMHSERVHLIFWQPAGSGPVFDAGYEQQIETFIARVAASSHSTGSIFGLIGQYGDGSGPAAYAASYAGAILDTSPLPSGPGSTCTEPLAPPLGTGPPGWNACVSDSGIEHELQNLIRARRLPTGLRDMYVVLTPKGLGSCFQSGPSDCALGGTASSTTPGYCGYHYDVGDPPILYAVIPYNAVPGHCQSDNPRPNASTADPAISTIAHEFAETATDPLGDAWSNGGGAEIADLCLTKFGPDLGGSSGDSAYDAVIDGGHYYIQELWSNHAHGCAAATEPDSASIAAPRRAVAGWLVTVTASARDPQGKVVGYRVWFGDGRTSTRRVATHAFVKAGTYKLTLRITDSWGNWAYATRRITIVAPRPRPHHRGAKR